MTPSTPDNPAPAAAPAAPVEPHQELFCYACGYSLRALMSDRCPECGTPVSVTHAAASEVPWSFRDRLGRLDAYFRTLQVALFSPRRLAAAGARPVSFADATRFRWVTVAITWPALAGLLAIFVNTVPASTWFQFSLLWVPPPGSTGAVPPGWLTPLILVGSGRHAWYPLAAALLPALLLATAPPAALFRRHDRALRAHHRVIALSYYPAAAGVALCTAIAPLILLTVWAVGLVDGYGVTVLQPATYVVLPPIILVLMAVWSGNTARILAGVSHASVGRAITVAVLWPFAVAVLSLACFVLAVYLYGYAIAVARSLATPAVVPAAFGPAP